MRDERQTKKPGAAGRYGNTIASNEDPRKMLTGMGESLDAVNSHGRKKVGSGDEMPSIPTMSMRVAQHDLNLEREKFNNQNAAMANNTF